MAQSLKCLPQGGCVLAMLPPRRQGQGTLKAHWPANLAKFTSSRFTMRQFFLKKKKKLGARERIEQLRVLNALLRFGFDSEDPCSDSQPLLTSVPRYLILSYGFCGLLRMHSTHTLTYITHYIHTYIGMPTHTYSYPYTEKKQ